MKDEHERYQDNASRRQDVVLDARDVDVAVRAVALHGTCGLWLILTLSGAALER